MGIDGDRPMEAEDREYLHGLYRDYYRALFSYASQLGFRREAAEDCVQDAFLAAARHIRDLRSSPSPRAYLQQTLKNVIGYHFRSMRYAVSLQQKLQERELRLSGEGPRDGGLRAETLYRGAVSDEDLRLLIRFYLEGCPQKDLAAELGVSLSACKKRIQRAKERLRSALEEADTG